MGLIRCLQMALAFGLFASERKQRVIKVSCLEGKEYRGSVNVDKPKHPMLLCLWISSVFSVFVSATPRIAIVAKHREWTRTLDWINGAYGVYAFLVGTTLRWYPIEKNGSIFQRINSSIFPNSDG